MLKNLMVCLALLLAINIRAYCQSADDSDYPAAADSSDDSLNYNDADWLDYVISDGDTLPPWDSLSAFERARILVNQAEYDSAAGILNDYIHTDSLDNEAWYLLGLVYDQEENLAKAMQCYHNSIELDSTYWGPWRDMAYLFDIFSQYDSMNTYMQKAIACSPNPESLYYDYAYSFDMLGVDDSALAYYKKALTSNPDDADSWVNIGAIWGKIENIDSARAYTLKALELDPYNSQACYNYAEILRTGGEYPKAIDYYQKALVLDASLVAVKLRLGDLYENLGDSSMAKMYYQEFIDSAPLIYLDDVNRVKDKLKNYR